jgi:glycerol-3-phosphate dehydrogenase
MVPQTTDGRVLFAVPWLGKVILGTTDTPRKNLECEPHALKEEVEFILKEAARYLTKAPTRADVKSIWVGLRPLVKPQQANSEATKTISREHTVLVSRSGLVTVTGGKWTTYRAMAEDVLDQCFENNLLPQRAGGVTTHLPLVGVAQITAKVPIAQSQGLHSYGDEATFMATLPGADTTLHEGLTVAMVRFAARFEYAVTVEDVLARRARLLFLDARKAGQLAPQIAQILEEETGLASKKEEFLALTQQYLKIPA